MSKIEVSDVEYQCYRCMQVFALHFIIRDNIFIMSNIDKIFKKVRRGFVDEYVKYLSGVIIGYNLINQLKSIKDNIKIGYFQQFIRIILSDSFKLLSKENVLLFLIF